MPPAARDPRLIGFLFLSITIFGWALNWPAIKFLLREWPPLFSRGVAGVVAALLLAAIARMRSESLYVPKSAYLPLAFAAFTNVFAWMGFGTIAMKHLSIGEGSLLAYTMPIWVMIFAWPVLGERPTWRSLVSIALGIGGLLVLFSGHGFALTPDKTLGMALALAAAILFALGAVLLKTPLPLTPVSLAAWQVGLGCLPMVVFGWLFEHPNVAALTGPGWAVLIYMTFVPMALCYLAWFAALRRLPSTTAAMATLAVPVIGVIAGAITVAEPLGLREIIAVVLTLAGVALALRKADPPVIE